MISSTPRQLNTKKPRDSTTHCASRQISIESGITAEFHEWVEETLKKDEKAMEKLSKL